jgi:hypothetical protein
MEPEQICTKTLEVPTVLRGRIHGGEQRQKVIVTSVNYFLG